MPSKGLILIHCPLNPQKRKNIAQNEVPAFIFLGHKELSDLERNDDDKDSLLSAAEDVFDEGPASANQQNSHKQQHTTHPTNNRHHQSSQVNFVFPTYFIPVYFE